MMWNLGPTMLAASTRTFFELMRLRELDQWWHWLLLALGCLLVLACVVTMYLADTRSIPRGKRWLLLLLRVCAFVGLLVFFLDLQKRTEQKLVKNSRVSILVDTSQSMGIADTSTNANEVTEARVQKVIRTFGASPMLEELREKHDVAVYRFDETNQPEEVASFAQLVSESDTNERFRDSGIGLLAERVAEAKLFWIAAASLFGVAACAFLVHLILGNLVRTAEGESWALLVSVFALIVALVLAAVSHLRNDVGPRVAFGWTQIDAPPLEDSQDKIDDEAVAAAPGPDEIDWSNKLEPRGGAMRIGDAIRWVLAQERGAPLAGIGVITDGNSNRGVEINEAASMAKAAEISIFPIGIGSELPPTNVRVVDLEAPARVYPGDEFKMTGYIQAYGLAGETIRVQMISRPDKEAADAPGAEPTAEQPTTAGPTTAGPTTAGPTTGGPTTAGEVFEADIDVEVGADGEVIPVPLQVTPEEVGKRIYTLKISGTEKDPDTSDNQAMAKVRIVDRKSRTLLLAGGPTREYRFLRNMLYRDKDSKVDVLLQTAVEGISQEADEILFDLPSEPSELFEYDAIVAFDPDWTQFDQTQLDLIEQWVAEKAGGLISIAGPVHTSTWAENRRAPAQINVVRQLHPVVFNSSRIDLGRYGSETAWPITITDDGRSTPFLNLTDEDQQAATWKEFAGVYGYYPIRELKPAATVFARYSDPQASMNDVYPPLIVGQFYGAGKVVFLGTGEFWRLRAIDNAYFERFYTKLLRYVSEGRLLRDSNRGLLLVDKDRALRGDTIAIRASVVDAQFQPLRDESISVRLKKPSGDEQTLELPRADSGREGMYAGRFLASQPGDYQLELTLPTSDGDPVVLEREVRVKLPNLEIERPQRNDPDLTLLAKETGGRYYVGLEAAMTGDAALTNNIISKRRETFLPGTPDREFQQDLRTWLLALIAGALFLEWTIRRLNKLA